MPNQCVHCSKIYDDASKEVLEGCSQCGGHFFFYIKKEKLQEILEKKKLSDQGAELTSTEKQQIEKEVREIAGLPEGDESPIFLDFESIKIVKPGKYLLDLSKLFAKDRPQIYQLEDGKYIVDLTTKIKTSV
jgi:predicted  nucleic acid-binding Zn-ribbon protein